MQFIMCADPVREKVLEGYFFDYAKRYCKEELHKTIMTVDAAPEAVKKYIHMGMKPIDEMQMIHGKCYVPMAMEIL